MLQDSGFSLFFVVDSDFLGCQTVADLNVNVVRCVFILLVLVKVCWVLKRLKLSGGGLLWKP